MPATRKPLLLLLALTGCGNLDELFCEAEGCGWQPGEWARVAALANPGPPKPDQSNALRDDSSARIVGQALFFDPAFSGTATERDAIKRRSPPARATEGAPVGISCATCHDLARAGVDTTSSPGHVSVGAGWTDVNALPVVNSAYREVVFWNGRADSLWALNVVVAESLTTLNGNRLRTAHLVVDNYLKTGVWPAEGPLLEELGRLLGRPIDCAAVYRAVEEISALPSDGKPGSQMGCQADDPKEPFGDAFDCLTAEQQQLVTSVLVIWAKAIAAYEYQLTSVDSPFDRFVREGPSSDAISAAAKRGAHLFVGKAGCVDCHSGPQLTDEQFHNVAVPQTGIAVPTTDACPQGDLNCDCSRDPGDRPCAPWGAYDGLLKLQKSKFRRDSAFSDGTDDARDAYVKRERTEDLKGAWRTPSLRNVALTAPYMHDGLYTTLEDVVWHYNTAGRSAGPEQIGVPAAQIKPLLLTEAEQADLVEFLRTLTGAALPERLTASAPLPQPGGLRCLGAVWVPGTGGAPGPSGAGGAGGSTGGSGTGMGGAGGTAMPPGTGGAGGVAMPPPGCSGAPPASPLITDFSDAQGAHPIRVGTAPNITGHTFTFAAPGRTLPNVVVGTGANGAALRVEVQTGTALDPGNGAFGFGLAFDGCLDVSAYKAVRFTIGGTPASCLIRFGITSPQNVSPSVDSRGSCPLASCYPPAQPFPLSFPSQPTTVTLAFGGPVPGSPNFFDPKSVIGVQWLMDTTAGAPCDASFTIDDVSFVP